MIVEKYFKVKDVTRVETPDGLENGTLLEIDDMPDEDIQKLMESKIVISELKSIMRKN